MKWDEIIARQLSLFDIALREDTQYKGPNFFDDIFLVKSSPTVPFEEIDLSTTFLGKKLDSPLMIASMVGGDKEFIKVNSKLAEFARDFKIVMGIGDQLAGLKHTNVKSSYEIVRSQNPSGLVLGNINARYFCDKSFSIDDFNDCVQMVKADGLEVYINPLQDILWNEDSPIRTYNIVEKLEKLIPKVTTPIFIKSMTTGLSNEEVRMYWDVGVNGIDIQGVGGTSFARMNTMKDITLEKKQSGEIIINPFDFWGIHTLWSLLDISLRKENHEIPLIVGGGIRNGIQAIKCLALGANIISIGYPILTQLMEDIAYPDEENVKTYLNNFIKEMKITMYMMGVRNLEELRNLSRSRFPVFGKTKEWVEARGLRYNLAPKPK